MVGEHAMMWYSLRIHAKITSRSVAIMPRSRITGFASRSGATMPECWILPRITSRNVASCLVLGHVKQCQWASMLAHGLTGSTQVEPGQWAQPGQPDGNWDIALLKFPVAVLSAS